MRNKKINKKLPKRELILLQNINEVKKTMKDELFLLPYISKLTGIRDIDFVYGGDNRKDVKTYFNKLCEINSIRPQYNDNVEQQKAGADFYYKGVYIDVKANGEMWSNACFEMYKDKDNRYYFKLPRDSYIIASFIKKTGKLLLVTSGVIEMLVNHDIKDLPVDYNFYFSSKIKTGNNEKSSDITNVYINAVELEEILKAYITYYCDNTNTKGFLSRGCIIDIDMSEYKKYTSTV